MMKLTPELFKNSFYYIAPGFDFEPLYRFSNICQTFIYVNLWYSKTEVLRHINHNFKDSPFLEIISIKEYDDFDEERYFELHSDYRTHLNHSLNAFSSQERENYRNAFKPATNEPQWMIIVDLKRKGVDRDLRLYYFTGEGLASYIALSHNGAFPPKVLCTIQTGVLECANGLMTKFLKQTIKLPLIWVRGFESAKFTPSRNLINAFSEDELFCNIGQCFNFKWSVNVSYAQLALQDFSSVSYRHCKAFISKESAIRIFNSSFKVYGDNKILYQNIEDLQLQVSEKPTLFIITSRLRSLFSAEFANTKILCWDEILAFNTSKKISLKDSLEYLSKLDLDCHYDSIYFIPFGLEDEGALLDEFLRKKFNSKMNAVVNMPLDFIDLRNDHLADSVNVVLALFNNN